MRLIKSRLIYALHAAAILGLCAIAGRAGAQTPLGNWLKSTPDRPLAPCASAPGTAQAPFFDFNGGTYFNCVIDGPYSFQDKQWYVLRMAGFVPPGGGTPADLIRVCSLQATHPQGSPNPKGPCHSANGVGPKGCEICVVNGVPQ